MTTTNRINSLGRIFGGFSILSQLLNPAQLNIIASFPGPIVTMSVGNLISPGNHPDDLDLLSLDYRPNTAYSVFNSDYEYLFSESTDRYLGGSVLERQLAQTAPHASFFYIGYTDNNFQPQVILLWLSREASPTTAALIREAIRDRVKVAEVSTSPPFSLFIRFKYPELVREKNLVLLVLKGFWQSPPALQDLFESPNTRRLSVIADQGRMLVGVKDAWLALVELDLSLPTPTIAYSFKVSAASGTGTERLTPAEENITFVAGQSFKRLSLLQKEQPVYNASQLSAVLYYDYVVAPEITLPVSFAGSPAQRFTIPVEYSTLSLAKQSASLLYFSSAADVVETVVEYFSLGLAYAPITPVEFYQSTVDEPTVLVVTEAISIAKAEVSVIETGFYSTQAVQVPTIEVGLLSTISITII